MCAFLVVACLECDRYGLCFAAPSQLYINQSSRILCYNTATTLVRTSFVSRCVHDISALERSDPTLGSPSASPPRSRDCSWNRQVTEVLNVEDERKLIKKVAMLSPRDVS
jgi:hypothetical protein